MLYQLPSGFVVTVCSPSLRTVLSGSSLAESCLATAGLSADELTADDAFALEQWAAKELTADPEAEAFAEVCSAFGCRPSAELGVRDRILAFVLDNRLLHALAEKPGPQAAPDSDGHVRFTTGGAA